MNKTYRYKHLRGRHDQRDHNRWPAGYQAQGYIPVGGGRRAGILSSRATGGLAGITQQNVLASKAKWRETVPQNAFARFVKKPQALNDLREKTKTLKDGRRFNPKWNTRLFRKVPRSKIGATGVVKLEPNPNIPDASKLPKRNYLWNKRAKTNNGFGNDAWLYHDSYIMPLVADALTTAMGMYDSSAATYIPGHSIVGTDITGFPFDLNNSKIVEDIKNGKINIEEQALVDLILGRNFTKQEDYVITLTPDGYALRSTNFNDTGVPTSDIKTLYADLSIGKKGTLVREDPKSLLVQLMIENKQNGSSKEGKKVSSTDYTASYEQSVDLRFSPETLHKLASAQYAIQYDPSIPEIVKLQIAERIQYVLGKAFHLNEGVSPKEMDEISMSMKNVPVGITAGEMKEFRQDLSSAGNDASMAVSTQTALANQPYRDQYRDSFPLAEPLFRDLAERMIETVDDAQLTYRQVLSSISQERDEAINPVDRQILDEYFRSVGDETSSIATINFLYQSVLNSGGAFVRLNEVEKRIRKIKKPEPGTVAFENYERLQDAMRRMRTEVPGLYNSINSYLQNPNTLFGGLSYMSLQRISEQAQQFNADVDAIQKFANEMFSENK